MSTDEKKYHKDEANFIKFHNVFSNRCGIAGS